MTTRTGGTDRKTNGIYNESVEAFRSVKTLRIDKRKLRLKPVRVRERVSPLDYNSFFYPRSLALGVRLYAFGSRAGILHAPARA